MNQGFDVLGEARPAVPDAGEQEALPNAVIAAHALAHHVYIGTQEFAQASHFIHERDLGSQEGVGGVFGQFRTPGIHVHDRVALAHIGSVQFVH